MYITYLLNRFNEHFLVACAVILLDLSKYKRLSYLSDLSFSIVVYLLISDVTCRQGSGVTSFVLSVTRKVNEVFS